MPHAMNMHAHLQLKSCRALALAWPTFERMHIKSAEKSTFAILEYGIRIRGQCIKLILSPFLLPLVFADSFLSEDSFFTGHDAPGMVSDIIKVRPRNKAIHFTKPLGLDQIPQVCVLVHKSSTSTRLSSHPIFPKDHHCINCAIKVRLPLVRYRMQHSPLARQIGLPSVEQAEALLPLCTELRKSLCKSC